MCHGKVKKSILWRDRTNSRSFVKTLVYSFMDGSILLETNLLIKCTKVNNKWINEHQSLQQLRHCAKDGLGGFLPVYIDNVKISDKTRNIYTFDYTNVNFDLVKYYEKIIWRRQPGQPLPQSLKCYFYDGGRFYFKFKDKFIYSLLKGNELKEEHYDIPPITLLSEDNKGNTTQLSSGDYNVEITTHGAVLFIYSLNPEALCTQIKFDSRVIWNRIPGENKPLYIIYSQESGRIEIVFEDKILLFDSKSANSDLKTLEIPPELTLYKTNQQGETVRFSLEEYRVQLYKKTGLRYTPSKDDICTELRHNNTVVWNHTDGPQPLSFIYQYRKLKRITVSYTKGTLSYELQDDQWTLTSPNNNTQSTT